MAGEEGLEPPTDGFGDHYSTNWAIPLNYFAIIQNLKVLVNKNIKQLLKLLTILYIIFLLYF